MDTKNRFHTATTYWIIRWEHMAVLAVCSGLMVMNWPHVHWWRAFWAFWVIDLVGYLPGMLAFRRSRDGTVRHWYHHVYNIAHTYLVTGTGVAIWAYFNGGFEWAMLAVPIHLSVDRGVFGNILKPVELAFEPREHSDEQVLRALGRRPEIVVGPAPTGRDPLPANVLTEILDHPSGYLALSKRNEKYIVDGLLGFIAYRQQGKHLFMFGGVHAAGQHAGELLDRFVQFASNKRCRVAAVQVPEDQVELFAKCGFTVNQMGSTYATSLAEYSFAGGAKMQLRNKISRARKSGLRVVELGKEVPRSTEWFHKLDEISRQWLAAKGKKELDFMVGEIGDESDGNRRIFLVLDSAEKPLAFISYVPVWGNKQPGYLHDLTRRIPDAPPGTMELCNATAIERFKSEGAKFLHFGFTPFIIDPDAGQPANRWVHRLIQALHRYGSRIYPADSQEAYKTKWGADIVQREYIAVRPLSLRAVLDLLLLTRSV